jgi:hypothetical protein
LRVISIQCNERQLGIHIQTSGGLRYEVVGILAAQNFAMHSITDNTLKIKVDLFPFLHNTFDDENGSIPFVTEANCTRSFPTQFPWYRETRGVQTIGAVMSSVSRYHSEIKQDDEQKEKSQNEKGKKQGRVEINTSEISSRIDTGEDTFMPPRVAVRAPVMLHTQDRFKVFFAPRRARDSKFWISTYPPGY